MDVLNGVYQKTFNYASPWIHAYSVEQKKTLCDEIAARLKELRYQMTQKGLNESISVFQVFEERSWGTTITHILKCDCHGLFVESRKCTMWQKVLDSLGSKEHCTLLGETKIDDSDLLTLARMWRIDPDNVQKIIEKLG
jgi:hypothetical protein